MMSNILYLEPLHVILNAMLDMCWLIYNVFVFIPKMLRITYHNPEEPTPCPFDVAVDGIMSSSDLMGAMLASPQVPLEVRMLSKGGDYVFLRVSPTGYILELAEASQVAAGERILLIERRPTMIVVLREDTLTVSYIPAVDTATYSSVLQGLGLPLVGVDRLGDTLMQLSAPAVGGSVLIARPNRPSVALSTSDPELPTGMHILLYPNSEVGREAVYRRAIADYGNELHMLVASLIAQHAVGKATTLLSRLLETLATYLTGPTDTLSTQYEALSLVQAETYRSINLAKEEEALRGALARCAEGWVLTYRLGSCLVRRDKSSEALPLLKRAFQLMLAGGVTGVSVGRVRAYMGAAIAAEGDATKGCANVVAGHQQAPDDPDVVCLLSRALCSKGEDGEAVRWTLYALSVEPRPSATSTAGLNLVHIAVHVPKFLAHVRQLVPLDANTAALYKLVFDIVRRSGMLEMALEIIMVMGSKAFDTEMLYQQACLLEESNRHWQVVLKCHHSLNNQTVIPLGLQKVSCLNADRVVLPLRGLDQTPEVESCPKGKDIDSRLRVSRECLVVVDTDCSVSTSSTAVEPSQLQMRRPEMGRTFVAPPVTAFVCGVLMVVIRSLFAVGRLDKVVDMSVRMNGIANPDLALDKTTVREDVVLHRILLQVVQYIPRHSLLPAVVREPIYALGDSHVLPSSWQPLTFGGKEWIVVPGLVPRLSLRDLSTFTGSRRMFDAMVQQLPFKSTIMLSIGDLDCKGPLLTAVQEGYTETIDEAARQSAKALLETVLGIVKQKHTTIFIHYPPPIVAEVVDVTMTLWRALDKVFGGTFADPRLTVHPLRLHNTLASGSCLVDPSWTISGTHYSPKYTTILQEEMEVSMMPAK